MSKRLVIADDHVGVRQMLVLLLRGDDRYQVVGEARTGLEALTVCREHRPDLLVLDLMLPELCGVEVLRRIREVSQTRVLIFTGCSDRGLILRALQCRPHGFVDKADPVSTLREALAAVASGACYLTHSAAAIVQETGNSPSSHDLLSHRETEILQMIAEGLSSKEIGSRLTVSPKTVENHRSNLMHKLALHNVADLTRYAIARGLVTAG